MPRASSSVKRSERGATLAELLVVLTIISILAVVAIPFAETSVQRRHETALRDTLRDVRVAIDRLNDDWREGLFGDQADGISANGYPTEIAILIDGIEDTEGQTRRYLRREPENPFAPRDADQGWRFLGYADPPDAEIWNGEDIYDLRPVTERTALDGSQIADW